MSTRVIRPNHRSITGTVQSPLSRNALHFESTLERDFLILLDFQGGAMIETQPVTIPYLHDGETRSYTPDVLIEYDDLSPRPCGPWSSILFEVKYVADLRENWDSLRPGFEAARKWAKARGGVFKIVTERHIRTPKLANVRLLRQPVSKRELLIVQRIYSHAGQRPLTVSALIAAIDFPVANARRQIFGMLRSRELHANLDEPLTDETLVWTWNGDYAEALAKRRTHPRQ